MLAGDGCDLHLQIPHLHMQRVSDHLAKMMIKEEGKQHCNWSWDMEGQKIYVSDCCGARRAFVCGQAKPEESWPLQVPPLLQQIHCIMFCVVKWAGLGKASLPCHQRHLPA